MNFIDTLTDQQYDSLCRINYTRKPGAFEGVETKRDFTSITPEIQQIIRSLPIVEVSDDQNLFDDFLDGNQQYFVLKTPNDFWLVDTQGYSYARYVVLLDNFETVEVES